MASEKSSLRRSKVLAAPLGGGQAGLLRELGRLADNRSGILKAWGRGLDDRMLWRMDEGRNLELTSFFYDDSKIMRGIILGFKSKDAGNEVEMYAVESLCGMLSWFD